VQLAMRPNLTEEQKTGEFLMTTAGGEKRSFGDITEVAQWATANGFGPA
jgi:hypothetical protein